MTSFDEAVDEEPDRFIQGAFDQDNSISDFGEFKNALSQYMNSTPNGEHGPISEQNFIDLFENSITKNKIKEKVSPEEFDKLYGDGIVVQREAISPNKQITITFKKIPVPAYTTKAGKHKKAHIRGYSNWTSAQNKFVQVRKAQGKTPKKIFAEYNLHFKNNPKTYWSVKSKSYRT